MRIHAVVARVKRADDESAFAIKAAAEHITVTQIQTPRKQTPTRAKKNQAGAIDLQLNIRRRSKASLKTKQQTIQATLRNNGRKGRGKKNASGAPATNAQKEIVAPEALLRGRRGRRWRCTTTATAGGAWSTTTTATANTTAASHTRTALGPREKRKGKKKKWSKMGRGRTLLPEEEE